MAPNTSSTSTSAPVRSSVEPNLEALRAFVICSANLPDTDPLPRELIHILVGMVGAVLTIGHARDHYQTKYPGRQIDWDALDLRALEIYQQAPKIAEKYRIDVSEIEVILLGLHVFDGRAICDKEYQIVHAPLTQIRSLLQSGRYSNKITDSRGRLFYSDYYIKLVKGLLIRRADAELFEYLRMAISFKSDVTNTIKYLFKEKRIELLEPYFQHLRTFGVAAFTVRGEETKKINMTNLLIPRSACLFDLETLEALYTAYTNVYDKKEEFYQNILHEILILMVDNFTNEKQIQQLITVMKWLYGKGHRPDLTERCHFISQLDLRVNPRIRMCQREFLAVFDPKE